MSVKLHFRLSTTAVLWFENTRDFYCDHHRYCCFHCDLFLYSWLKKLFSFILRVMKLLQHHFFPTRLFPIPIDTFVSMKENNLILKYFLRKNTNQPSSAMLGQMILPSTNISSIPFIAPLHIFLLTCSVFLSFFLNGLKLPY